MRAIIFFICLMFAKLSAAESNDVLIFAAGSLKIALTEIAEEYQSETGVVIQTNFGPSGLIRRRIEEGETAHVFASANMKHPKLLKEQGISSKVIMFAKNKLCAIAQPEIRVTSETLLESLLRADVRVGTSTPNADPSGDYAWKLFQKAEKQQQGAFAILDNKALKLTGGKNTERAPKTRNQYAWVMENKKADIFLTYCTNARLAKQEMTSLKIIAIPAALEVGASYGLTILNNASAEAKAFATYLLNAKAQTKLTEYGFTSVRKEN